MQNRQSPRSDAPPWVTSMDTPVWVTGPGRTIAWMNEKAAVLLGVSIPEGLGRPCHEVVRGLDPSGRPFCAPDCQGSSRVRRGKRLAPFRISLTRPSGTSQWLRVLIIPVKHPDTEATSLVHCVVTSEREARMERYLRNVANRWDGLPRGAATGDSDLTEREAEILDLLSQDQSLHDIAEALSVSYVTVRNHVQHILGKMGVHSIAEAVARRLLSGDDAET